LLQLGPLVLSRKKNKKKSGNNNGQNPQKIDTFSKKKKKKISIKKQKSWFSCMKQHPRDKDVFFKFLLVFVFEKPSLLKKGKKVLDPRWLRVQRGGR